MDVDPTDTVDRRIFWWLALGSTCLFVLLANGVAKITDEYSVVELTRSVVYDASLHVTERPFVSVPGRGGSPVSKYGIGHALLAAPFDLVGSLVSFPLDDPGRTHDAATTMLVPVASGFLVAWSYRWARALGASSVDGLLVAVGGVVGSMTLVYATEFFAEPVVTLLLVITAERVTRRYWTHAFAASAVAIVVHPRMLPIVGVLGLLCLVDRGWWRTVRHALPVVAAIAILLLYNVGRFGDPLATGYEGEGFSTPVLDGLHGLFLTPEKSLFVFAPLVVLGLLGFGRLRNVSFDAYVFVASTTLIILLMTATWHSWQGGWSWGPRFLVPIVPLLTVPAVLWIRSDRRRQITFVSVAALGFVANLPAVLAPSTMQLGRDIGPSIALHYQRLHRAFDAAITGRCDPRGIPEELHCMPAFWQVHVARSTGAVGTAIVVIVSLLLAVGVALSARRVRDLIMPISTLAGDRVEGAEPVHG